MAQKTPSWLRPLATGLAILIAGLLLAGMLAVPYRASRPPHGYDQARLHWNTKNTTRFAGADLAETAALVSRAVYPALAAASAPQVVILYPPEDWQAGLQAAPLLRPLGGLLLPATDRVAAEITRLDPGGAAALDGARVLLAGGLAAPDGVSGTRPLAAAEIATLLADAGAPPQRALLVDGDDPATALLAAPWAAYAADLVVFDATQVPAGLPVYTLGAATLAGAAGAIGGATPAQVAVNFASYAAPDDANFGWGMNANTQTGYRAYTLARLDSPATALLAANLAVRGKPGPLLWTEEQALPQVVNNYVWSQRAAFWVTPAEGPFHHFWILGDTAAISFPAQGQADYAVEIGPYMGKGAGLSGIEMLATAWIVLGIASAAWILFHQAKFLPGQMWLMGLAWPLLALMLGPFGLLFYYLAYNRPILKHGEMVMWDRPLWLQGLAATASAVGFGASLMVASGFVATLLGLPLIPSQGPLFFLGSPMILVMILNYVVAVLISWLVFQTPMLAQFTGQTYGATLGQALPLVLASMTAAALAMNPGMWWWMMSKLPMMPTEESILWFGVMFTTALLAFLLAWPLNYVLVRRGQKSGLM
jgi:hypothetical protein